MILSVHKTLIAPTQKTKCSLYAYMVCVYIKVTVITCKLNQVLLYGCF